MTDKEFKRLNRSQLIEIIYQLQLRQEKMTAENERLSKELEDKRIRVDKVGNIADAALEINNVMQAAQSAAAQYLDEVRLRADEEGRQILQEARDEAAVIILQAQVEAAKIIAQAKQEMPDYDQVIEAILKK
jgi:cell division septum initiation protein DivIVA